MAVSGKFNQGENKAGRKAAAPVRQGTKTPESIARTKKSMQALWDEADAANLSAIELNADLAAAKARTGREMQRKKTSRTS